jgi:hypothetical protein
MFGAIGFLLGPLSNVFGGVKKVNKLGPLAHLVERHICNVEVTGSSPVRSTSKFLLYYFYAAYSHQTNLVVVCGLPAFVIRKPT